jgi:hypothetical protein
MNANTELDQCFELAKH